MIVAVVLAGFGVAGMLSMHWGWLPMVIPLLFLCALAFSAVKVVAAVNPLHHLAEGLRELLLRGVLTMHLVFAALLRLVLIAALIPLDLRLFRRRVLGEA